MSAEASPHSNTDSTDNEWLPDHCPTWCDRGHSDVVVETGDWEAAQEHFRAGPGGFLDEIRNPIDHRVVREGGDGWHLSIRQRPMRNRGLLDIETINLEVDSMRRRRNIDLKLTSGEARTLARQLVAMADVLDL